MESQVIHEEVMNQQPSAVCYKEEEGQLTRKPKLTMKLLYELIRGLQHENFMLVQQVDKLEQQFAELRRFEEEAAAAAAPESREIQEPQANAQEGEETLNVQELYKVSKLQEESIIAVLAEVLEPNPEPSFPQPICVPRSERHQKPKRNSFWPIRFHHRTI